MEKTRLCSMTQEEVDSYLKEKKINVSVMMEHGFDKDGDWAEVITDDEGYQTGFGDDCVRIEKLWGFSSPNGFHTFEFELTEVQAQYATVLFHKLYEECNFSWNDSETLALSFVNTCTVPFVEMKPMNEMEQEEIRKQMIDIIDSGNLIIPEGVLPDEDNHVCFITAQVIAEGDSKRFTNEFDAWVSEEGQKIIKEQVDSGAINSIEEWNIIWDEWFAEESNKDVMKEYNHE
jgi:hypothetical protein